MKIQNFILLNDEKITRSLEGVQRQNGTMFGGIGEGAYMEDGTWKRAGIPLTPDQVKELEFKLLAEYDKFAGPIKVEGDNAGVVVCGSFYDFKSKKPHVKPNVMMRYLINGQFVVIPLGKETGEVKAAKTLADKKGKKDKKEKVEEESVSAEEEF